MNILSDKEVLEIATHHSDHDGNLDVLAFAKELIDKARTKGPEFQD